MTRGHAFSLIELLVVVSIVALLTTLALPALRSIANGYLVTQTSGRLAATIERGRMHAATTQRVVGVRIIEGGPGEFTSVQLVVVDAPASSAQTTTNILTRPFRISEPIIISAAHSSLLQSNSGVTSGTAKFFDGGNKSYREFLIFPNGLTSLAAARPNPYLCVATRDDAVNNGEKLKNPLALSIDPITCRVTLFRR